MLEPCNLPLRVLRLLPDQLLVSIAVYDPNWEVESNCKEQEVKRGAGSPAVSAQGELNVVFHCHACGVSRILEGSMEAQ
eukprot:4679360-Amphidinium_carterae.2